MSDVICNQHLKSAGRNSMNPSPDTTLSVTSCQCDELESIAPEFRAIVREHCRKCEGEPHDCVVVIMRRIMGERGEEDDEGEEEKG